MNTNSSPAYLQGRNEKKIMERPLYNLDEIAKQYELEEVNINEVLGDNKES